MILAYCLGISLFFYLAILIDRLWNILFDDLVRLINFWLEALWLALLVLGFVGLTVAAAWIHREPRRAARAAKVEKRS